LKKESVFLANLGDFGQYLPLAVNGTLMRGLALNQNLLNVGATFEREAMTAPIYRLWSMDDCYPGMIRVNQGGGTIALEIWSVPLAGLGIVLGQEPPGLTIGKVVLDTQETVLGVLAEPFAVEGKVEITRYGGWRAYSATLQTA
jgi:hypothetical protein